MLKTLLPKAVAACRPLGRAARAPTSYVLRPALEATPRHFSSFHASSPAMEVMNMKVPTMGDSITEGTIVEWSAEVGQLVKEGDVIALIETDKVTIDIKAEVDGVLVAQFGAVDDNIEVGADLYQIDTEATESSGGFFEVAATDDDNAPADATEVTGTQEKASRTRIPSIAFLGKDGWAKRRTPSPSSAEADTATGGSNSVTVEATHLGAMYGRLPFSDREMEALLSGGADEAPELISRASGAVFTGR